MFNTSTGEASGCWLPIFCAYGRYANILTEKRGTLVTGYAYDGMGQLTRVDDPHENASWTYEYDQGGNLKAKKKYAYTTGALGTPTGTQSYEYGDANWRDLLTKWDQKAITYDVIGNPLTYNGWTYTWEKGRQLKQMSMAGKLVEFAYDAAGLRIQKKLTEGSTVTTTDYTLLGKLLMHLKQTKVVGTGAPSVEQMHFFYDHASRPILVKHGNAYYSYLHNLQGDIVAIIDTAGTKVVEYKYDAWGRTVATTGSMVTTLGKLNPFRYRGYVYDEETQCTI